MRSRCHTLLERIRRNHLVLRERDAGPSSSSESVSSDAFVSRASSDPSNGPACHSSQTRISILCLHASEQAAFAGRHGIRMKDKNQTHVPRPHLSFLYTLPTDSEPDLVSNSRTKGSDPRRLTSMILRGHVDLTQQWTMTRRMRKAVDVGELSIHHCQRYGR